MKTLEFKLYEQIKKTNVIKKGDMLILALSGGADSVCLFHLLRLWKNKIGFDFVCVHVNHGIREVSGTDEKFVRELCDRYSVTIEIRREAIPELAKTKKVSIEEVGREVRREVLYEMADRYGAKKILMAHHLDDSVETFLLNLARGCGLSGLHGIKEIIGFRMNQVTPRCGRGIHIIRPLLHVKKLEIVGWLQQNTYPYVEDESNADNRYTRNYIRNEIIPSFTDYINPKFSEHVSELMSDVVEVEEWVKNEIDQKYPDIVNKEYSNFEYRKANHKNSDHIQIDITKLLDLHLYLQKRILKKAVEEIAKTQKDISRKHIESLFDLMKKESGKKLDLPYFIRVYKDDHFLVLQQNRQGDLEKCEELLQKYQLIISNLKEVDVASVSRDLFYTKYIDYDIIESGLTLRFKQEDDYIVINKEGQRQKLNRYFINNKVPKRHRDHVLLVADGHEVVWIVGYRLNYRYQITELTTNYAKLDLVEDADVNQH